MGRRAWTSLMWFRIRTGGIFVIAEEILAVQKGFFFVELDN